MKIYLPIDATAIVEYRVLQLFHGRVEVQGSNRHDFILTLLDETEGAAFLNALSPDKRLLLSRHSDAYRETNGAFYVTLHRDAAVCLLPLFDAANGTLNAAVALNQWLDTEAVQTAQRDLRKELERPKWLTRLLCAVRDNKSCTEAGRDFRKPRWLARLGLRLAGLPPEAVDL